jgi:hypothetical protein
VWKALNAAKITRKRVVGFKIMLYNDATLENVGNVTREELLAKVNIHDGKFLVKMGKKT